MVSVTSSGLMAILFCEVHPQSSLMPMVLAFSACIAFLGVSYFCKPNIPRGLDAEKLQHIFMLNDFRGKSYTSVSDAFNEAKRHAAKNDLIYVGGSTFVVAEII